MLGIVVYVVVNANGEYEVGTTQEECFERWNETGCDTHMPQRLVAVTLHIPTPKPVEIECTVPDEVNEGTATVRG